MSGLPGPVLREIDRVCTLFEDAWKSGAAPRVEAYCPSESQRDSAVLLRELLFLELEYRQRNGEWPSADEYAARFPHSAELVAQVWQSHALCGAVAGFDSEDLAGGRGRAREGGANAPLPAIAGYEVLRWLGRGGMANVYLGRDQQLGRMVALKLLSAQQPSEQAIERLRAEAHAVARLHHPNIVQIFEIGEHHGQPYLALEFIDGVTLAERIAGTPHPPRDGARLVEILARAIHAAHENGVVHRDLKPANVLLGHDATVVKVTDFGLVKFLDADPDPRQTQSGIVVGTVSYMAPEQAGGGKSAVGPAADVYALGAILYELITGRPPFKAPTVIETAHLVQSAAPVAPRQLQPQLPRDLETVALKCLEKEPPRRYASALELADDLARFLRGEPVRARPVRALERAWRWSRRNPLVAGLALATGLALASGAIISTYFAVTATRRASDNLRLSEGNRLLAAQERAAREHAQRNEEQARKVLQYLINIFHRADPQQSGRGVTIAETLDAAVAHLDSEFADDAAIKGQLAAAIGQTYLGLGLTSQALELLERGRALLEASVPAGDARVLVAIRALSRAHRDAGDLPRALALAREAFDRTRATLGDDHAETMQAANELAMAYQEAGQWTAAGELHEKSLLWARQTLGENDPATLAAMSNLAWIYLRTGRVEQARGLYERALDAGQQVHGPDHPATLAKMNGLSQAYAAAGQLDQAISMLEQVLTGATAQLGEDHPNTLATMGNLARAYREAGRFDKALPLCQRALELKRAKLGEDHPETINELASLAVAYELAGDLVRAVAIYEQVLRQRRARLGDNHPSTILSFRGLGQAYRKGGRFEQAEATLREGFGIARRALPDEWSTFYMGILLGGVLVDLERFAEAQPILLQSYDGLAARIERVPPAERHCLTNAMSEVVKLFDAWGKAGEAARWRARQAPHGPTRSAKER
jgi:tetratricopeptide (TPR) repeat protein